MSFRQVSCHPPNDNHQQKEKSPPPEDLTALDTFLQNYLSDPIDQVLDVQQPKTAASPQDSMKSHFPHESSDERIVHSSFRDQIITHSLSHDALNDSYKHPLNVDTGQNPISQDPTGGKKDDLGFSKLIDSIYEITNTNENNVIPQVPYHEGHLQRGESKDDHSFPSSDDDYDSWIDFSGDKSGRKIKLKKFQIKIDDHDYVYDAKDDWYWVVTTLIGLGATTLIFLWWWTRDSSAGKRIPLNPPAQVLAIAAQPSH